MKLRLCISSFNIANQVLWGVNSVCEGQQGVGGGGLSLLYKLHYVSLSIFIQKKLYFTPMCTPSYSTNRRSKKSQKADPIYRSVAA